MSPRDRPPAPRKAAPRKAAPQETSLAREEWLPILARALALTWFCFGMFGCGVSKPQPPVIPKVEKQGLLIIGVDSLSPVLTAQIAARGVPLPCLGGLVRDGCFAPLATLRPTLSPAIWTTIATGKRPAEHGIQGFVRTMLTPTPLAKTPGGRPPPPRMAASSDRLAKALWNMASDRGIGTGVVSWWVTWPAEPIDGVLVSDRYAAVDLPVRSCPESAAEELLSLRRRTAPPVKAAWRQRFPRLARILIDWSRNDTAATEYGLTLLARPDLRLVMVYLRGLDPIGHHFFRYSHPDGYRLAKDEGPLGAVLPDYYRLVDELVQRLIDARGNRRVLIVSDHGMENVLGSPACLDPAKVADFAGVLAGASHGSFTADPSRVLVDSADPEELAERFRAIQTRSGDPLFTLVEPVAHGVQLSVNRRLHASSLLQLDDREVPLSDLTAPPGEELPSGTHENAPNGFFAALGPGVSKWNEAIHPSVMDIAPTALALLDLAVPRDMPGRVLPVVPSIGNGPRTLATYEDGTRLGAGSLPSPSYDAKAMEELRDLGYVQ